MHTFTQSVRGAGAVVALMGVCALLAGAGTASAQTTGTTPPVTAEDSARAAAIREAAARAIATPPVLPSAQPLGTRAGGPPITAKRAFLYSLMIPGWGQSRLDRNTTGAFFAAIELGAIAMIGKTSIDLRQARRYSGDSIPANYGVDATGKITPSTELIGQLPNDLANTRRLHREDWLAAMVFNHLISGAEAFVSAQLWDVPATLSVKSLPQGTALVATVRFR